MLPYFSPPENHHNLHWASGGLLGWSTQLVNGRNPKKPKRGQQRGNHCLNGMILHLLPATSYIPNFVRKNPLALDRVECEIGSQFLPALAVWLLGVGWHRIAQPQFLRKRAARWPGFSVPNRLLRAAWNSSWVSSSSMSSYYILLMCLSQRIYWWTVMVEILVRNNRVSTLTNKQTPSRTLGPHSFWQRKQTSIVQVSRDKQIPTYKMGPITSYQQEFFHPSCPFIFGHKNGAP